MSKSRDIADSAATINFIDGLTSDAQSQIDSAVSDIATNASDITTKAPLSNPTFTGTVTATAFSGDGSGLTGVDSLPSQTGNAGNYLTTDGTNPSWAEVSASPTLEATASGSLANGDMVIVNADGTVSVVTETLGPSLIGGKVVYNSATSRWNTVGYDSNSNKIVVAYRNDGNSNYGTAVVGTVSGTSITFGSPVVFNSGSTLVGDIVFDSNSNKIVILYRNDANSFYGTGIVGTVSGDSISFGSPSLFLNAQAEEISGVFDTSTNKIAVFYRYVSNGNKGYASVGEVSGTSITFTSLGSQVQFNNDQTLYNSCVFDSNSNKCVVFYRGFPSDQGKARVGTISGLSISFGTEATFNAARSDRMSSAFDSNSNKCVVSYSEFGDSQKGKCVVGTVSGTSISFGSPVVFETDNSDFRQAMTFNSIRSKIVLAWMGESGGTYTSKVAAGTVSGTSISFDTPLTFSAGFSQNPTIIYDSGNDSSVLAYMDNTNSSYGTAQVFKSVTTSTTLTSENFIGVSDAAYSDGATAKIQLVGSVDDAQSGLTAGQTYYVQGDNTLSETPADPSVVAGTAVSATKLIVKG